METNTENHNKRTENDSSLTTKNIRCRRTSKHTNGTTNRHDGVKKTKGGWRGVLEV